LLRGINVSGRIVVAMTDLREAFEANGYQAVSTYIGSGNVLFASEASAASFEDDLEAMLKRRFRAPFVVVLRSDRRAIAASAQPSAMPPGRPRHGQAKGSPSDFYSVPSAL
jgi:uncharacterized protein (DUF1697 family)